MCGTIKESTSIKGAVCNPCVIVEVISENSDGYDRGDKMRYYLSLPTLREYVLIAYDMAHVTVYRVQKNSNLGSFHYTEGTDATVVLQSLDIDLPMRELYANTSFIP